MKRQEKSPANILIDASYDAVLPAGAPVTDALIIDAMIAQTQKPKKLRDAVKDISIVGIYAESGVEMAKMFQSHRVDMQAYARTDEAKAESQASIIEGEANIQRKNDEVLSIMPIINLGRTVDRRAHELGARRGYWGAALAGGLTLATLVNAGLIYATSHNDKDKIFQQDASIFPGAKFGFLPGTPDIRAGTIDYPIFGDKIVVSSQSVQDFKNGNAQNPAALDYKLTGTEKAIDEQSVEPILSYITKNKGEISSITIIGKSSDDPPLGIGDAQDDKIATERAATGKEALLAAAAQGNIVLPTKSKIQTIGEQELLTAEQQANVSHIAEQQGMDENTLLANYYTGKLHVSADQKASLDKYFAAQQGIEYDITLKRQQQVTQDVPTETFKKLTIGQRPGEILVAGYLFLGGIYSFAFGGERLTWRVARRRAQRNLRKAAK